MNRESLLVLYAKGIASALTTWKALLVLLAVNAALAAAWVYPVGSALHETLDRSRWGDRLATAADATFARHFLRMRPDVLGNVSSWEDALSGTPPERDARSGRPEPRRLSRSRGAMGTGLALGFLNGALAAVLAAGFAGRFAAEREKTSLAAFGADCARYGLSSLLLGAASLAAIAAAFWLLVLRVSDVTYPQDFRYEWEAVGFDLLRLFAFLLVGSIVRLVVVFTRAALPLRGGNLLAAFASALGFLARRPFKGILLEIAFGLTGLIPLLAWGAFAPSWDGREPLALALFVLAQQVIVGVRIGARVSLLGAASSWMRRVAEKARPAPEMIEAEPAHAAGAAR